MMEFLRRRIKMYSFGRLGDFFTTLHRRDKRLTTWEISQSNPFLCMKRQQLSAKAIMISRSDGGFAVPTTTTLLFFLLKNVSIKKLLNGFPSFTIVANVWYVRGRLWKSSL